MSGPNQHHIPQFLQRAFGVKPKGKRPKEIWLHRADVEPELRPISKTASADYFYSTPSADGSETLDDKITETETPLSNEYARIRGEPFGSVVDAGVAADLVTQLAPRSSHIRFSMASGASHLAEKLRDLFTDTGQIEKLLGLDEDEPSGRFLEKLRKSLGECPEIEMIGLPAPVLERVAFYTARERFNDLTSRDMPFVENIVRNFVELAPDLAKDAHNRLLDQMRERNVRRDHLISFSWTIEQAPSDGAILPDCVALAYRPDATVLPLMYAGKEMDAVVMPLSTDKLLVGRRESRLILDLTGFNRESAACSNEFFLAKSDNSGIAALAALIGTRTRAQFKDATEAAFDELLPKRRRLDVSGGEVVSSSSPVIGEKFQYQISCIGYSTEEFANGVAETTKNLIGGIVQRLPISRLDGVTFTADYLASLREVDRGRPDLQPVETVSSSLGVGFARMVTVIRDGQVKGRVVLDASVGDCLVGEDVAARDWALNVLVHQLTLVAMLEWCDRALPGTLLEPIDDEFQAFLYQHADAALHGHIASFISASFGNPEETDDIYRDLLVSALGEMKESVEAARLIYRYDGDLEKLLTVAMQNAGYVLQFAAKLLGNREGSDRAFFDDEERLNAVLHQVGLINWFADFGRDLKRFRHRLGAWQSFDEFLAFNRHIERLLWAVGLFPWKSPNGIRVEVPLLSDAAALCPREV